MESHVKAFAGAHVLWKRTISSTDSNITHLLPATKDGSIYLHTENSHHPSKPNIIELDPTTGGEIKRYSITGYTECVPLSYTLLPHSVNSPLYAIDIAPFSAARTLKNVHNYDTLKDGSLALSYCRSYGHDNKPFAGVLQVYPLSVFNTFIPIQEQDIYQNKVYVTKDIPNNSLYIQASSHNYIYNANTGHIISDSVFDAKNKKNIFTGDANESIVSLHYNCRIWCYDNAYYLHIFDPKSGNAITYPLSKIITPSSHANYWLQQLGCNRCVLFEHSGFPNTISTMYILDCTNINKITAQCLKGFWISPYPRIIELSDGTIFVLNKDLSKKIVNAEDTKTFYILGTQYDIKRQTHKVITIEDNNAYSFDTIYKIQELPDGNLLLTILGDYKTGISRQEHLLNIQLPDTTPVIVPSLQELILSKLKKSGKLPYVNHNLLIQKIDNKTIVNPYAVELIVDIFENHTHYRYLLSENDKQIFDSLPVEIKHQIDRTITVYNHWDEDTYKKDLLKTKLNTHAARYNYIMPYQLAPEDITTYNSFDQKTRNGIEKEMPIVCSCDSIEEIHNHINKQYMHTDAANENEIIGLGNKTEHIPTSEEISPKWLIPIKSTPIDIRPLWLSRKYLSYFPHLANKHNNNLLSTYTI
jgi:hypothetical protein